MFSVSYFLCFFFFLLLSSFSSSPHIASSASILSRLSARRVSSFPIRCSIELSFLLAFAASLSSGSVMVLGLATASAIAPFSLSLRVKLGVILKCSSSTDCTRPRVTRRRKTMPTMREHLSFVVGMSVKLFSPGTSKTERMALGSMRVLLSLMEYVKKMRMCWDLSIFLLGSEEVVGVLSSVAGVVSGTGDLTIGGAGVVSGTGDLSIGGDGAFSGSGDLSVEGEGVLSGEVVFSRSSSISSSASSSPGWLASHVDLYFSSLPRILLGNLMAMVSAMNSSSVWSSGKYFL